MAWREKGGERRVIKKEFWLSLLFVAFVLLFLQFTRREPCWDASLSLRVVQDPREYLDCARFCFKLRFTSSELVNAAYQLSVFHGTGKFEPIRDSCLRNN